RVRGAPTLFHLLTLEDPHLHTDGAEGGLRRGGGVVDIRSQRVERHATLVVAFDARDLRAAKPAAALDLDALRAHAHRALHRALHGATERDALRQLARDVVGDQLRVELGTLDLLDVDADFLAGEVRQLVAQLVDFSALLADHDTRTTRVQRDHHLAGLPLDDDVGDRGMAKARLEILAQELVFLEQRRQLAPRVVAGPPVLADAESEADRMSFLSH